MRNERQNIIFIMLDTFRADYLSDYGGERRLKALESLASKGTVYKQAVAPATYTAPSHLSMFLGKRVLSTQNLGKGTHKTNTAIRKYVGRGEVTLAKSFEYLGYRTAMFSSNAFLDATMDLSEGFSHVSGNIVKTTHKNLDILGRITGSGASKAAMISTINFLSAVLPRKQMDSLFITSKRILGRQLYKEYGYFSLDRGAESLNTQVKEYLAKQSSDEPNFLFLNYMEAHEGYPTQLVTNEYIEQDRWMYMSHVIDPEPVKLIRKACGKRLVYLDKKISELMRILRSSGALDNATVIITSDHGQAFMEHDQMYHFVFPYEQLSRVPLIVSGFRDGKQASSRKSIAGNVSLTDLYGMITNIAYGSAAQGIAARDYVFCDHIGILRWWATDIFKTLRGRSSHIDSIYKTLARFDTNVSAIYHKNYKLMHFYEHPENDELYDLSSNHEESSNIIGEKRQVARQMLDANKAQLERKADA